MLNFIVICWEQYWYTVIFMQSQPLKRCNINTSLHVSLKFVNVNFQRYTEKKRVVHQFMYLSMQLQKGLYIKNNIK